MEPLVQSELFAVPWACSCCSSLPQGGIAKREQLKASSKIPMLLLQQPAFDVASAGTQLVPLSLRTDNLIAAAPVSNPVGSHINLILRENNNNNDNNNLEPINMDYNNLKEEQVDVEGTTYPPPLFDFGIPRNTTTRSGQTAIITCRVEHLGDKMVAWIRKRDLHILTVGMVTYSSDERFEVKHAANSKDWTLHVKYAQPRDTGIYECQVNTEPKISMAFRLNVIVTPPDAKAIITGPADLYVKVGSAITLTCHVKQPSSAQDIGPIYWYRGPYILTPFVAHPNEAAIDLQRISMESKLGDKLQSRLRIANAQTADSGNYTCMPTTADAASVLVNVINDESPAAMQKSAACSVHTSSNSISQRCGITIGTIATLAMTAVRWLQQQQQQHTYRKAPPRGQQQQCRTAATSFVHITLALLLLLPIGLVIVYVRAPGARQCAS